MTLAEVCRRVLSLLLVFASLIAHRAAAFCQLNQVLSPVIPLTLGSSSYLPLRRPASLTPLRLQARPPISVAMSSSGPSAGNGGQTLLLKAFAVLGKSTRWTVAGLVGLTLLIRRDAAMVNFTAGAILNAFLAKILKRIIREQRPDGAELEDHGMPSSHAMSLFYMTSFVIAVLSRGVPSWWPLAFVPTVATLLAYVLTASCWRIFSGLHTPAQILAGAAGGTTVGLCCERLAHDRVNAALRSLLSAYPNAQVPLPYVAGVMVVGALTVGSVERKIGKLIAKLKQRASESKEL